ncbi:MAG TPA: RNA polymerase factor sigma-54 [Chthoniobacteraceae bacterium]|jgi:RNA polymerase sigma-54 factor|nr:rpoN [Chthoniobacter sp.]HEV7867112.1 RNA polymerase factor sigma-54 [Chthoniobacteraceae bacterium]
MAGLSQTQSLSQSQVLAPQLQQSLQILQVPMLELRNLIQQELQSNPTVEEDQMEPTIEDKQQEHEEFQEEFDRLAKLDEEWRDYMSQSQSYSGRSSEEEERRQFFFDSIVGQQTLQQHLLEQVASSDINETDRQLAELIIGNIDDTGFLQTTPEEISQNTGMEAADLERILELVQTFHPVGVGSRNLRECLLIQLRRLGKEQSLEFRMVDKHLEDLGKRRFPEIARRLGTTAEQVQRAANFIGTLDPKPGQIFTPDPNNYVLPDVNVERVGDDYQITLNGEQIPHLRISNTYKDLMSQEHRSNDVKDYIRDKIRSGKFLIKSIHQRQQTISNIAHEIVARQKDFLDYGPSALKPLTMVQIADAVGVHETTVSRAISGKYIQTPQGVFEMKYFFTPGYQTAGGESLSNTSVKGTIAELVKAEDGKSPLSDKEIVEILEKRGIPIARRTVAKYRNELNILPSNMRKKY